jgi:hypothetical protein
MEFRVVWGGGKGHKACRRVGGDWGKCAHMIRQKGQRERHLFIGLTQAQKWQKKIFRGDSVKEKREVRLGKKRSEGV